MALFGSCSRNRSSAGFPQSAYICALVYGSFALFRALSDRERASGAPRSRRAPGAGSASRSALGAAAGAVVLLPLSALGGVSDRAGTLGYSGRRAWPTGRRTCSLSSCRTSTATSPTTPTSARRSSGKTTATSALATFLLAFYGGVARAASGRSSCSSIAHDARRVSPRARPGDAIFHVAYLLVPGMKLFRFPTRFLIVVELGLALLAAIGLTRLGADLARRWRRPRGFPRLIAVALCAATALDLLHPPAAAEPDGAGARLAGAAARGRARPGRHPAAAHVHAAPRDIHRRAFQLGAAAGRTSIRISSCAMSSQPNTGRRLSGHPSADCYAGISPAMVRRRVGRSQP